MGLLFSMVDQRVYLIQWEDWTPLADHLAPAHINWLAQPVQLEDDNNSTIPTTSDQLWISTDQGNPFLTNPCGWHSNATVVYYITNILRSQKKLNATFVQRFFQNQNGRLLPDDQLMWHSVFWTLFRFTNRTAVAASQMLGMVNNSRYYVGAHVRTGGNATSFRDPNRHGSVDDWQAFADCTHLMQTELAGKCGGTLPSAYVASDNDDAKTYLVERGTNVHA